MKLKRKLIQIIGDSLLVWDGTAYVPYNFEYVAKVLKEMERPKGKGD